PYHQINADATTANCIDFALFRPQQFTGHAILRLIKWWNARANRPLSQRIQQLYADSSAPSRRGRRPDDNGGGAAIPLSRVLCRSHDPSNAVVRLPLRHQFRGFGRPPNSLSGSCPTSACDEQAERDKRLSTAADTPFKDSCTIINISKSNGNSPEPATTTTTIGNHTEYCDSYEAWSFVKLQLESDIDVESEHKSNDLAKWLYEHHDRFAPLEDVHCSSQKGHAILGLEDDTTQLVPSLITAPPDCVSFPADPAADPLGNPESRGYACNSSGAAQHHREL
ncbi:hypothetical protein EV182_004862, partial [Spiromyces aspiralis]